jgi:glycosyltransferase involved in cell wall biosynthesis
MAKYTIDLLTNEKKYRLFSQNARERAINNFDINKVVPEYENYYNKVLEK